MRLLLAISMCFVSMFLSDKASAHAVEQGYVYLSILDTRVDVRVELNVADVNRVTDLAIPEDGSFTLDRLREIGSPFRAYVEERLNIKPDGQSHPMMFKDYALRDTEFGQFAMLDFTIDELPTPPKFFDVRYALIFDVHPEHRGYALIENDWRSQVYDNEALYSVIFSPDSTEDRVSLENASIWTGILGMIESGAHHIWIGIDHLLFLFALLLPAVMVRDARVWQGVPALKPALIQVVKIVTLFTIGHSVTLILAALGVLSLPSRLVESIIALSIAVAAIDILYPIFERRILWVIFLFGLMHGFGFANVLAEMPIPDAYVVPSLFGFNVGVELGQLVVVVLVVPVLYLLRNTTFYRRVVMPAGALLLIAISMYWFTERAFDVDLPAGAIIQDVLGLR